MTNRTSTPAKRITINVSTGGAEALDVLMREWGVSQTDAIDRAIQRLAYLEQVTADGGDVDIYVREVDEGERSKLRFI